MVLPEKIVNPARNEDRRFVKPIPQFGLSDARKLAAQHQADRQGGYAGNGNGSHQQVGPEGAEDSGPRRWSVRRIAHG